jgi:hypothetical protein
MTGSPENSREAAQPLRGKRRFAANAASRQTPLRGKRRFAAGAYK